MIKAITPPESKYPKMPLNISIFNACVIFQIRNIRAIPIKMLMATVPFNNLYM